MISQKLADFAALVERNPSADTLGERGSELAMVEPSLIASDAVLRRTILRIRRWKLTFDQYASFIAWAGHMRIQRGLSPNTLANYLLGVSLFAEYMNAADKPLQAVTPADVEAWQRQLYVELAQKGRTRSIKLTAVRRYFDWIAYQTGTANPIKAVPGPKRDKTLPKKFTKTQLKAIMASCDTNTAPGRRNLSMLLFMYATGCRRHEMASLRLDQVVMQQRVAMVKFEGKGAKERMVKFEGPAVYALQVWLGDRDKLDIIDHDAVWVGLTGRHKGLRLKKCGVEDCVKKAAIKAGIKDRPTGVHRMRISFATDLYDQNVDLERIRMLMGHEDINTTRGYLAISDTQLKTCMPASAQNEILGATENDLPLWYQQKLEQRTGR